MKAYIVSLFATTDASKPPIQGARFETLEAAQKYANEKAPSQGKAVIYQAIEAYAPLPPPPPPARAMRKSTFRNGIEFTQGV